jgi:hypothetical protein
MYHSWITYIIVCTYAWYAGIRSLYELNVGRYGSIIRGKVNSGPTAVMPGFFVWINCPRLGGLGGVLTYLHLHIPHSYYNAALLIFCYSIKCDLQKSSFWLFFINVKCLSSFYFCSGNILYNFTPIFKALFWYKDVVQPETWRSRLPLVSYLCTCRSSFCYFICQQSNLRIYIYI